MAPIGGSLQQFPPWHIAMPEAGAIHPISGGSWLTVGWAMGTNLKTQLVLDAMNMAIGQRKPSDVIHHSDQGSHTPPWRSG